MKCLSIICAIIFSAGVNSVLAFQSSTPVPQTAGTPLPIQTTYETQGQVLAKQRTLKNFETQEQAKANKLMLTTFVDPLYRNPTEAELLSVAVDPAVKSIFVEFLKRSDSGIFKMTPDLGCAEVIGVKPAGGECLKYPFPGAGNAYSFRFPGYRMRSLSDLSFTGAKFFTPGAMTQGIIVKLGDVPIESVGLKSGGLAFLSEFQPSSDFKAVETASKRLEFGTEVGGFRYSSSAPVEINMTYALRSIAYRGEVLQSFQGAVFNELDYDKRGDVIVVFRTVGFDKTGTLLIIWHELSRAESPRLKLKK